MATVGEQVEGMGWDGGEERGGLGKAIGCRDAGSMSLMDVRL